MEKYHVGILGRFILALHIFSKQIDSMGVRFLSLSFLLFTSIHLQAQRGWELGGNLGVGYYFGDLNSQFDLGLPRPSGGVLGKFLFNTRTSFRLGLQYSLVEARDSRSENTFQQVRNLSFRSHIGEVQGVFEFNFLPLKRGDKDHFWTPYVFLGGSFLYFEPQARYQEEWVRLRPLGTEGQAQGDEYLPFHGALVYGLGVKLNLNTRWTLFAEVNARAALTDYIDDVSTTYPDNDQLRANRGDVAADLSDRSLIIPGINDSPLGEEGRQRGEVQSMDQIGTINIGITYFFGDLACPEISRPRL